ncbi:MAG: enolase C-terminal domain-like protein [Acidimicrobiales bacterium]
MPAALGPGLTEAAADAAVVDLWWVRVPLRTPFVASHGTETDREVVLVRVTAGDGATGWGECDTLAAPTYTAEHTAGAFAVLRDLLVPAVLAAELPAVAALAATHPMATAAVEVALVDVRLRRAGRSLAEVLGADADVVPAAVVVGRSASVDDLVRRVAEAVEGGAPLVTCKVAPDWFAEPLRALRSTFPGIELAADANGAFGVDDARAVLAVADEVGLAYLEQPIAPADDGALVAWASAGATPIALDESVVTPDDARRVLAAGAAVVNLKPARVGGLRRAWEVLEAIGEAGAGVFVGGLLELGVGRATGLALAAAVASRPGALPTDLGPSARYVVEDLTPPIVAAGPGRVRVPAGPGLGVVPVRARVDHATVAHAAVHP